MMNASGAAPVQKEKVQHPVQKLLERLKFKKPMNSPKPKPAPTPMPMAGAFGGQQ